MSDPNDSRDTLSRIFIDVRLPAEEKGQIMEASRKAKVKFQDWALRTLKAASRTSAEGEGFHLSTKGGALTVVGAGFSIALQTDEESAREFVDFLNVAIAQTNQARLTGNS